MWRDLDSVALLILSAVFLLACGTFAIIQAATGHFLPHDEIYLGITASQLCAVQDCRILQFMIHDRVSFGGVVVAIGALYLWLTMFPLRRRESWAWTGLASSGFAGFLSFLTYLGHGYFDTWHGAATLALLVMFVGGLIHARQSGLQRIGATPVDLRSSPGFGRALLLLSSIGIGMAGLTIMTVGMTSVFVPQDLEFMAMTRDAINGIDPELLPLIAHDRAGFGGALVSFAVAMFACVRYGRPSRGLWQTLAVGGVVGFGTAVGVHPAIGYLSVIHLGPAILGCVIFATGLVLTAADYRSGAVTSVLHAWRHTTRAHPSCRRGCSPASMPMLKASSPPPARAESCDPVSWSTALANRPNSCSSCRRGESI